jgi:hypothetical protein
MTEDRVTALQRTGSRFPAGGEPGVQQFIRGRLVVPDRDRVDRAESRGVEHEERAVGGTEEHVVCVLVLNDDIPGPKRRLLTDRPPERLLQRRIRGRGIAQFQCLIHENRICRTRSEKVMLML